MPTLPVGMKRNGPYPFSELRELPIPGSLLPILGAILDLLRAKLILITDLQSRIKESERCVEGKDREALSLASYQVSTQSSLVPVPSSQCQEPKRRFEKLWKLLQQTEVTVF